MITRSAQLNSFKKHVVRRLTDKTVGRAIVANGPFRLLLRECNLAGKAGDVIILPDHGNSAWVVSKEAFSEEYESWRSQTESSPVSPPPASVNSLTPPVTRRRRTTRQS